MIIGAILTVSLLLLLPQLAGLALTRFVRSASSSWGGVARRRDLRLRARLLLVDVGAGARGRSAGVH